jgi:hypothetical protein
LLSGCGGIEAKTLTIHAQPATGTDFDRSCIGVVGFEMIVDSSPGRLSSTFLNGGPVLDVSACELNTSYTPEHQPGPWSKVAVLGKDGAGTALVGGSQRIDNLPGTDVHVLLRNVVPQQAVLVVDRTQLLNGEALADTTRMVVTAAGRSTPLIDVSRSKAGVYFDVEPAAYTVSSANLGLEATDDGLPLTIELTTAPSVTRTSASHAIWERNGAYYQAK